MPTPTSKLKPISSYSAFSFQHIADITAFRNCFVHGYAIVKEVKEIFQAIAVEICCNHKVFHGRKFIFIFRSIDPVGTCIAESKHFPPFRSKPTGLSTRRCPVEYSRTEGLFKPPANGYNKSAAVFGHCSVRIKDIRLRH